MSVGEKIKNARKSAGLSQQQLGGEEFTKGYISQIEKGIVNPSMNVLNLVSERLHMPISYFLDEKNNSYKGFQKQFIEGENLFNKKQYKDAVMIFRTLAEVINDGEDPHYYSSLLYSGKCLFYLERYDESMSALSSAEKCLVKLCLYDKLADCHSYLGHCYFSLKRYFEAVDEFKKSFDIINENGLDMKDAKAKLLLNTGSAYSNIGNFRKALKYFNENILYCQKNYIADTLLDSYVRMGYCYYMIKKYDEAEESISKAVSVNRALKSDMVDTEIYSLLALIASKEGRYKEGFDLLKKSMEIALGIHYEFGYNMNIAYHASVLADSSRIDEAEKYAESNLQILEKANNKIPFYFLQGYMGNICKSKGDIEKAKYYLESAVKNYINENFYWEACYYSKILADTIIEAYPCEAKYYYNISHEYLKKIMSD